VGASAICLTKAEDKYCVLYQGYEAKSDPEELICVGAALGGGFPNTQELHVKKYKEATKGPGKEEWEEAVFNNMIEW
jgi:hypothetical protein